MRETFAPDFSAPAVACPFCSSHDTNLLSLFGQQLLTTQYYCQTCHTPFEHIKDAEVRPEQANMPSRDHAPLG